MSKGTKNLAASVRQRLLNLSRVRKEDFQLLLTRFALERLMYRLAQSEYAGQFVVKGAILFSLWVKESYRTTRDLDLMSSRMDAIPQLVEAFQNLCRLNVENDGIIFASDTVQGETIREDQPYAGIRITLTAFLEKARIPLQVDVGFGDAITPQPKKQAFEAILGFPAPKLKVCPPETVIAEKFEAMVTRGIANSRMKDFYDIWFLATNFEFEGDVVAKALTNTFARRRKEIPKEKPLAFSAEFYSDVMKQTQWNAFLRRSRLADQELDLARIVSRMGDFLIPVVEAASQQKGLCKTWKPESGWE